MNVGMITCYINNFGACLQAYALQKAILSLEHQCRIIRYTPVRSLQKNNFFLRAGYHMYMFLKGIIYLETRYENARKHRFSDFRSTYLLFSEDWFSTNDALKKARLPYDAYVVGSDQLWNPLIHGNQNNPVYFLDFVPEGKRKIAYAPSIGIEHVPDSCINEMRNYLIKFDELSCREISGSNIVQLLTGRSCKTVLDPTLLITIEDWQKLIPTKPLVDQPYIFLYLFGQQTTTGNFIEYIAKRTGKKVVCIPFERREIRSQYRKISNAGPLEFLNLIRFAELVITDSFHATAFSINLNVPFYSLLRNTDTEKNNMNSRIFNILEMTGLCDRLIRSEDDFPEEISIEIDFTNANEIIEKKRECDLDYLKNAIDGNIRVDD